MCRQIKRHDWLTHTHKWDTMQDLFWGFSVRRCEEWLSKALGTFYKRKRPSFATVQFFLMVCFPTEKGPFCFESECFNTQMRLNNNNAVISAYFPVDFPNLRRLSILITQCKLLQVLWNSMTGHDDVMDLISLRFFSPQTVISHFLLCEKW